MCLKYVAHNLLGLDHAVAELFRLPSDSQGIGSHHVLWKAWVSSSRSLEAPEMFVSLARRKYSVSLKLQHPLPFYPSSKPSGPGSKGHSEGLRSEAREFVWVVWVVGGLLGLPPPPAVVESGSLGYPPNSTAHRFCAGYKLQKLDPSCGLQITLSCILSRPWELEKTVHEGNTISSWGRKQKS